MKHLRICIALLSCSLFLSACKKEDPNPELKDPIYSDLEKRQQDAEKAIEAEQKNQDDLKTQLEKAEPNSIDLKNVQKSLLKSQRALVDLKQQALYYKIRTDRRLHVDRITYLEAFKRDKVWPDPREYSDYLTNIHLQEASRNWDQRVPKLQDRIANAGKAAAKADDGEKKKKE